MGVVDNTRGHNYYVQPALVSKEACRQFRKSVKVQSVNSDSKLAIIIISYYVFIRAVLAHAEYRYLDNDSS